MARWRDGEMARWRDGKGDEMKISSYQDLDVWKRGMDIAVSIFMLTKAYPSDEKFGMISQMRRAANSIPANIAEGWARQSKRNSYTFYGLPKVVCENWKPIFFYRKDADYQTPQKQLQYWMRLSSLVNN